MLFEIVNTRTKEKRVLTKKEVEDSFLCDTFADKYWTKEELQFALDECEGDKEEEELILEQFKSSCNYYLCENDEEYYTEMIEYEPWCSPTGIAPLWKVVKIR